MPELKQYDVTTEVITTSQTVESNCNTIDIINVGAGTVLVDGCPLQTLQCITDLGNRDEINVHSYLVTFNAASTVVIRRKVYKNH